MSECTCCGRWAPADQETGYDADEFCPDCQRDLDTQHEADADVDRRTLRELIAEAMDS